MVEEGRDVGFRQDLPKRQKWIHKKRAENRPLLQASRSKLGKKSVIHSTHIKNIHNQCLLSINITGRGFVVMANPANIARQVSNSW